MTWNAAVSNFSRRYLEIGYLWSILGVSLATTCFWLVRSWVDTGQASLLYLPVVIACAVRFGFRPAVLGAVLSFLCWNFFFLAPIYTFEIRDPKDWLSLIVFLIAAIVTAQLAAQARSQAQEAREREVEIATLFSASEAINQEVRTERLLAALAEQLQSLCHATRCLVLRRLPGEDALIPMSAEQLPQADALIIQGLATAAYDHNQIIGLDGPQQLWIKALGLSGLSISSEEIPQLGAYVPLNTADARVGVLHVGPREDGRSFLPSEQRMILTLANHAAVVLARDALAEKAAQATALRQADALKDSLLSLVSHELRSPLAAIKAAATGLMQPHSDWEEPGIGESLAAINSEADRLSGLVSNLLDLSRLEAGAWQPSKDWCDLSDIIGSVLDRMAPEEASRVQVELGEDSPLIRADYIQIALVLANLLDNAVKYSDKDTPIMLTAERAFSGSENAPVAARIHIHNFGAGIIAGEEERIFERFFRGSKVKESRVHGTGLGLALCYAIIAAHGGRIWAKNADFGEPSGVTFSVSLPVE